MSECSILKFSAHFDRLMANRARLGISRLFSVSTAEVYGTDEGKHKGETAFLTGVGDRMSKDAVWTLFNNLFSYVFSP